jgi:hypothetical protein
MLLFFDWRGMKINHRELMLSTGKLARFAFLALPEDLQDEVMFGLDNRALTLGATEDPVKERMRRGEGLGAMQ